VLFVRVATASQGGAEGCDEVGRQPGAASGGTCRLNEIPAVPLDASPLDGVMSINE
jgi:hypothetical protein